MLDPFITKNSACGEVQRHELDNFEKANLHETTKNVVCRNL